jgi:two-component system cell cycle response regulator
MNREVQDRIMACTSLPAMPPAALRVLDIVEGDDSGLDKLAAIIGQDAALSTGILRAVNSGFYEMPMKVASIQQAAALLGLPLVKTLVLGLSLVMSVKAQQTRGPNHVTYWRRSMYCASAARLLAARVLPSAVEDCFVAALLMDLGTLVLDRVLGEAYEDVCDRAKTHGDLLFLEAHAIGITHAEAGGILARKWKLPPMMEVPIAAHHGPESVGDASLRQVAEVVSLAGRCADVFVGERPAETIAALRKTLLERYQIGEADCDALLCEVGRKAPDLGPAFGVPINSPTDYESIREKASQRLLEISLAHGRAADLPVNKRRNARMRRDGKIPLTPCANGTLGKQVIVRLKDLSACGIGLTHTHRLERGTQFIIQLPQPNGLSKSLLYTVSRCEMVGGVASIGAELTAVLRPEAVRDELRISSGQAVA